MTTLPGWCLVADLREEAKAFKAGTLLHCYPPQWGDGYESVVVFAENRKGRMVEHVLKSRRCTGWRALEVMSTNVRRYQSRTHGNPIEAWRSFAADRTHNVRGVALQEDVVKRVILEFANELHARAAAKRE